MKNPEVWLELREWLKADIEQGIAEVVELRSGVRFKYAHKIIIFSPELGIKRIKEVLTSEMIRLNNKGFHFQTPKINLGIIKTNMI